jgi:non-homologous end joining protein Ku
LNTSDPHGTAATVPYGTANCFTLTEADLDKAEIESTKTIEITNFVEAAQINPKSSYKPYFLKA